MSVYDANGILTELWKDRSGKEILREYNKWYDHLKAREFHRKTHWLDNEASEALKHFDKEM